MYKDYYYDDNFEALLNDFREDKQIVLFLGAGINISNNNGLDWNALLDSLFSEALTFLSIEKGIKGQSRSDIHNIFDASQDQQQLQKKIPCWNLLHKLTKNEFSPLIKASIIKSVLGDNYIASIQNYLYKRCNRKILKDAFVNNYFSEEAKKQNTPGAYYSLFQITRLILLCSNIRAVVTYNFDNYLSESLRLLSTPELQKGCFTEDEIKYAFRQGLEPQDISSISPEYHLGHNIFPIYHIHGYIPSPNELLVRRRNDIVLSMDEFYDNFGNVFSWQTATQLHFLSHYTCVFAGSSLSDITTQRMIFNAHEQNKTGKIYYMNAANTKGFDNPSYKESYLNLQNIKNSFYKSYGLSPIYDEEGYTHLFSRFNELIEKFIHHKNEK